MNFVLNTCWPHHIALTSPLSRARERGIGGEGKGIQAD